MWLLKVATIAAAATAAGLQLGPLQPVQLEERQLADATSFIAELPTGQQQADPTSTTTITTTAAVATTPPPPPPPPPPSPPTSTSTTSTTTPPPPPPPPPTTTSTSISIPPSTTVRTSTSVAPPPPPPPPPTTSTTSQAPSTTAVPPVFSPPPAPTMTTTSQPRTATSMPVALPASTTGAAVQQPPPQGAAPQPPTERLVDPAQGAFIGGDPTTNIDVPVTFLFLLLFAAGAYTHIRIYRANAKRGHKFLLSDLMFDFCMVRTVTCIMRIVWAFEKGRVVILVALIVQFGGAVVVMVVNIFFAQRIVRSIHPHFGWHPAFRVFILFFLFSVPAVVVSNSTSIGVSFFKIEDQDRVDTALNVLKAGVSWIMLLAVLPVIIVIIAAVIPGPRPERFGQGDTHQKIAVLFIGATLLIGGHAVRLAATLMAEPPNTPNKLFSREVFYTTGFMLEIFVVVFYAVARIDLLFHVPNGSKGPGDYSRKPKPGEEDYEAALLTREEIEDELAGLGHPYEVVDSSGLGRDGSGRTIVAFSTRRMNGEKPVVLPPRPEAYSRVRSIRGSVRSMRGSMRSAGGGISRMMSVRRSAAPYLNEVEVGQPEFRDNPFQTPPVSHYGVAQPLFIQSRFSRYTDPEDARTPLRPESQATSGEIPLSLDREGLGPYEGRPLARRSSVQKFTAQEREGNPLK